MTQPAETELSAAKRALLRQIFAQERTGNDATQAAPAQPRSGRFPASAAQRRLWFIDRLDGQNPVYNVPFFLRIDGPLAVDALWSALDDLVASHESLRTTLSCPDDDEVYQVVAAPGPVPRSDHDLRGLPAHEREAAAAELLARTARIPFDLQAGPLLRAELVALGPDRHYLVVVLSHVITDGWSEGLIFAELGALYAARLGQAGPEPAPLPLQYADYAEWEAQPATTASYRAQLEYWRGQLDHLPAVTTIPPDFPRPLEPTWDGASVPVAVPANLQQRLAASSAVAPASLFTAAATVLAALISRYNGASTVLIGVPAANRAKPEFEGIVGYFANTLVLRADLDPSITFAGLLERVQAASIAALEHQNVPFDRVVDHIAAKREPGKNPVFQIMCSVNRIVPAPSLPGLATRLVEAGNQTAKFDLELAVAYEPDRVTCALDYATELYQPATAERLAADYERLMRAFLESPDTVIADIELTGAPGQAHASPAGGEQAVQQRQAQGDQDPDGQAAPRTATEIALAGIWSEVLGRGCADRSADFFHAGGDSLLATKAVARIRRAWPVKITVRQMLQFPVLADLAALIDAAGAATLAPATAAPEPAARPSASDGDQPVVVGLSTAQRGIWILNQLEGQQAFYHMPLAVRLSGVIDRRALGAAIGDLVSRHGSLRSVFPFDDGAPRQVVRPAGSATVDLTLLPASEADLEERLLELAARPFDLTTEIPIRAWLLELGPDEHVLLLVLHHIACDGLSWQPLCDDLATAYAARRGGQPPSWAPLPVQFADHVLAQQRRQGRADDPDSPIARQLAFWSRTLDGLPDELALPGTWPRPPVPSYDSGRVEITIPGELHQAARELARSAQASLFMLVQTGLAATLSRSGAGTDLAIGSPAAGRLDESYDRVIGCFVNTVVLRTDTTGNPSFRELLNRVREADLEAFANLDLPFDLLVEHLNPVRMPGRNPLFQVMLSFVSAPEPVTALPGVTNQALDVFVTANAFDLLLELAERYDPTSGAAGVGGYLHYSTSLFSPEFARDLARRFEFLLQAAVRAPDTPIWEIALPDLARVEPAPITLPPAAGAEQDHLVAPVTVERELAAIVAGVLGLGDIDRDANFFAAGGHSLLATLVVTRAREAFDVHIPLSRFFERPTVAGFAEEIAKVKGEAKPLN